MLTLALDATAKPPSWVSWVQPDANVGEVTVRTYYCAHQAEKGLQVPFGYLSVIDWRNAMTWRLYVDRV